MSHLLTLPLEVRTLIYDFYLEGFMLEVREKARSIWQATFVREFEIEDNVLSLRLACRQVYAELAPRVAAQTQLHLTTTYSDRSRRSDAFHPFALLPREFLCKIRTLHVPYYLPHRSPLVYNRALATLPGLEVVTYDGLHLEISEALDNLPAHDLDWTTSTLHSITNLIKPSKALAYLKTKLKIRLQDIWVNDGPVSFYREASVSIGTLGGRGGDESLWVCILPLCSQNSSNTDFTRRAPLPSVSTARWKPSFEKLRSFWIW